MQLFLALALLSCAQFGALIILPALPDIAHQFNISGNDAQQIVLLYFVGFGLSLLLFGPWCDSAGSRKVFLFGQSIFILGSIVAFLAYSPNLLALGRLLQGIGAGAPFIISRSLLSETMRGDKLKSALATLGVVACITPVLASVIGGWITKAINWQGIFLVISGYLVIVWSIGFRFLPKPKAKPEPISYQKVSKEYGRLLIDFRFLSIAMFKWITTLLFFSSQTLFPFEFQQRLSINAQQFGTYMMIPACGLIAGSILVKWLQNHLSHHNILIVFMPLFVVAGWGFYTQDFSLKASLFFYSVFMLGAGVYYVCSLQMIIKPFPKMVGTVNALTGAIDMLVFSALAALVNKVWVVNIKELGLLYLFCTALLFICWLIIRYQKSCRVSYP